MDSIGLGDMMQTSTMSMFGSSNMSSQLNVWTEMLDNEELLKTQYDLLAGQWPQSYNEVVLIVGEDNGISDYVLYALGLKDQNELAEQMKKIQNGEIVEKGEETSYTYEELLNLKYKLILNSDYYNKENGIWVNKSEDKEFISKFSSSPSSGNSSPENTFISLFATCSLTISASFDLLITYSFSSFVYPTPPAIPLETDCSFCFIIPTILISSAFVTLFFINSLSSDLFTHIPFSLL